MRSYFIEGLDESELKKVESLLTEMQLQGSMPGLFWLPIPSSMHTPLQEEHAKECGPYVMGFEIQHNAVQLELLVRAQNALHCACVGYASPELQMHMMRYVEELLEKLSIRI